MGVRADLVAQIAPAAPPCFEARSQWVTYLASAAESQKATKVFDDSRAVVLLMNPEPHINPQFAYCRDCSAIHSDRMLRAGKCKPNHLKDLHERTQRERVEAGGLSHGLVPAAGPDAGSSGGAGLRVDEPGRGEGRPADVPGVPALPA